MVPVFDYEFRIYLVITVTMITSPVGPGEEADEGVDLSINWNFKIQYVLRLLAVVQITSRCGPPARPLRPTATSPSPSQSGLLLQPDMSIPSLRYLIDHL